MHYRSKTDIERGHRSGLETKIADQLKAHGTDAAYESVVIRYVHPERASRYTPDFTLPNGIVIETKGRFLSSDRQKHKWIKAQHPALDIRFVFSNARTRLNKKSDTTYADWCSQYGFLCADKIVPIEWMLEPPCPLRIAAIEKAQMQAPSRQPLRQQ